MKIYNYSEARQNFSTVLNAALQEEVIITRRDGTKFKLFSILRRVRSNSGPVGRI
ncbi:MAG: type II toxin-antitoxin system Phd/YefM family antitoxin [Gracilibacteraceae bacterium]|jgi:prevent-host-death family protein|nr:type II toxin-antitoxin system Phd/YefM family antitoxin [Gracilibacteraceae bacterium]